MTSTSRSFTTALRRPWIKFLLRLALTMTIVTVLVRVVGWRQVAGALSDSSMPLLSLMYVIALMRQGVDAAQLSYLMRRVGMIVPTRRVFLASQLSSFYSLAVPGEIAASAAKWANLSAATGRRSLVLNALLYNKLLLTAATLLMGSVALLLDNPFGERWTVVPPLMAITAIVTGMILLYSRTLGLRSEALLRGLSSRLPRRAAEKAHFAVDSMAQVRAMPRRAHMAMSCLTVLGISVGVLRFFIAMKALGIDVSLPSVLWIAAFLRLAALLPLTIGNLGIREGLLIVALSASAVPAEQAVALGLLGFSTIIVEAIIGAGYQIALVTGLSSAAPRNRSGRKVDEPRGAS